MRSVNDKRCVLGRPNHRFEGFRHKLLFLAVAGLSLTALPIQAQQQPTATDDKGAEIEEVMVTGSRRKTGSAVDVPAPVDFIGADQLARQGSPDMTDLLRNTVPSLNVNDHTISGTSTAMRPATLRGLSPDHTLILVNGKRRHRGADIPAFSGGITDGSQGPDISSIPTIALKEVQVLRDGAAAQYGADAVAGVINFILNDDPDGGRVEAKLGSTYEGDGDTYQVAGTWGMPLGDGDGFVRFSGEYRESDMTDRGVQRADAASLQAQGYDRVPDPATRFGTADIDDDLKTFVNLSVDAGPDRELYAFGNFSKRKVALDFFYRNPVDRFGVFTDADNNYLIGDMDPSNGIDDCPMIAVGSPGHREALAAATASAECFNFQEMFPGGYTPTFGVDVADISGTVGVRGTTSGDVDYDVSLGSGRSRMSFFLDNVVNPSMGALSPTTFPDVGDKIQFEKIFNIDLSKEFDVGIFHSPLNVAGGFEWHDEEFEIKTGSPESFQAGPLAGQGFLIGAEAYPGYSPQVAGVFSRKNTSLYLDLEADVTEALVLGTAVRYEDFSDFGSETTYKIAGLYRVTDELGVRSTFSTGFHAPTPGQQNNSALTTELTPEGSLVESGVVPPTSQVAALFGGKQLKPETSESFTFGFVYEGDFAKITLDYYFIEMQDRFTDSGSIALDDATRDALVAEGYQAAAGLGTFSFLTNDFDSETEGVDLVVSIPLELWSGVSNLSLTANWTDTKVTSYDPNDPNELLSAGRVTQLEENNPEVRGNVAFTHEADFWRALVRVNYYGPFTELHVNSAGLPIDAGRQITVDVESGFRVTENMEVVLGAQNVFDSDPERNPWDFILGSKYPTTAPAGVNGGFYYAKVSYQF